METLPLRAIVADGDTRAATALATRLEQAGIAVVGIAADARQAIEAARDASPHVALVDVGLPGDGTSATRDIVGGASGCRVVALSSHEQRGRILQMLLAGAVGYVVRGAPDHEITAIVRRAARAEAELSVNVMTNLMIDLLREVADRTESEARLRRSEERFRGLLESAPDAVVITNEEGEIVLVNRQTEMMFGYERTILVGQRVEFLLPERFHVGHVGRRLAYQAAPRARTMGTVAGLTGRRMDGREFSVDVSLSTLDTDEGMLVIAFVRDISARERAGSSGATTGEVRLDTPPRPRPSGTTALR